MKKVLIANRGEIAIRIARACADLEIATVAIFSTDDAGSLHVRRADEAAALPGIGAAAYLDIDAVIAAAVASGCDAVHPGYGFLSENPAFASRCGEAGLTFVGPEPETLALFGDKAAARALAARCGLPLASGSDGGIDLAEAHAFFAGLGGRAAIIKAVSGGGGRGMRVVREADALEDAFTRCASEAKAAFGSDALYIEEYIERARHIEIQVVGDATGTIAHLHDRECSAQRRHQKLVEIAPSPWLEPAIREQLSAGAITLAAAATYRSVGTVEFLVETDVAGAATGRWLFMEMNPRLQVEHTVTEEVTGVDLVQAQLRIAAGETLDAIGITAASGRAPAGFAIQLRINMETFAADGATYPSGGVLRAFDPPSGGGVRVESFGYQGYETVASFDSLLAKLVVHAPGRFADTVRRAYRALCEFRVEGVETNIPLLQNILLHPDFAAGRVDTRFIEREAAVLAAPHAHPALHAPAGGGATVAAERDEEAISVPDAVAVRSPMQGQLVVMDVGEGDVVSAGQRLAVVEAMKMEHAVFADVTGTVVAAPGRVGQPVRRGAILVEVAEGDVEGAGMVGVDTSAEHEMLEVLGGIETIRAGLADEARPIAVAKARKRDAYTARERIAMLCDTGSFTEVGGLVRVEGLDESARGDSIITGTATIEGRPVVVISQDFSLLGGSMGHLGTEKLERAIRLALNQGLPFVMLLDGGGHRIQDGQNSRAYARGGYMFHNFARLSGYVPVVAAVLGFGFAANTNFCGMADFVVMVRDKATMGLAGPALVKAGTGEEIDALALGGAAMQVDGQGLADLGVANEDDAFAAMRDYLSYLPTNAQHPAPRRDADPADDAADRAEALLGAVPVNTRRTYDVRPVIAAVADRDSVFELKPTFATNMVTAFARIAGRPVGFIANQAASKGGMIDSPACEKAAHFIALCDAFALPLVFLMDVPGFFIGSDAEKTNLGRRSAKVLFELGHATVPRISVILRKGYGLGFVAMAGGRSFEADACLAWPTAEICAMSVEGSVDVAYRKDYESAPDPAARRQEIIDSIRAKIGPIQAAEGFGVDDLIDPRTTRARLKEILARAPERRVNLMPAKVRAIPPI
ncbi:acetyl-CoA carboxylase family protein [Sphingomonas immobilis]|uniref:acetyl-CoA carboxylase n=1 Tax=Sphingomonas immobilis TaxID=3063997 RepID=A0ABT9A315_9SPHN|nr:carboxyl transferase domain-containing protein [Sphingomonas sp. CA1-15]MDO7843127.1 carboxyl transferase domain-containing protein [Sphingomonas sp. CA1-15]